MNFVQIMGHLGGDAETRFTKDGKKVTSFTVACNNRRGENEETIWWRVTIWGDRFDKMVPYLKKGTAIIVYGEMKKPEIWTGQDGQPRVTLELTAEIIKFSPFGRSQASQQSEASSQSSYSQPAASVGAPSFSSPMGYGANSDSEQSSGEDPVPF